jgi:hypothetical protein
MQKPRTRQPAGPAQPGPARILGAAVAAVTEQGCAGATALDIATRAKVSKPSGSGRAQMTPFLARRGAAPRHRASAPCYPSAGNPISEQAC